MEYAITTQNLTCYFGHKCAVNTLNLAVPKGKVFALLGRNGAGKSTTIRMLMGMQPPTLGHGQILQYNIAHIPAKLRARIGYLAEGHHLYPWMSIAECERFQSHFYPHWNKELFQAVLENFDLGSKTKVAHLSRGERAGLALALTLAPEPELLILDDPAIGLDPVARRVLLEALVYVTQQRECTVVFSSHLLADVERVADYIAIMEQGILKVNCPLEILTQKISQLALLFSDKAPVAPEIPGLLHWAKKENELSLTIVNFNKEKEQILSSLGATQISSKSLSLEDALIHYLGKKNRRGFFVEI